MIKLKEMISEYQYQQGKNNRFPEEIYYDDVREALTKIISTHPFSKSHQSPYKHAEYLMGFLEHSEMIKWGYKKHRNIKDVAQDIFGRKFTEGLIGISDYIGYTTGYMEDMGLEYDEDLHLSEIEDGYENNIEPKETATKIVKHWKR